MTKEQRKRAGEHLNPAIVEMVMKVGKTLLQGKPVDAVEGPEIFGLFTAIERVVDDCVADALAAKGGN